MRDAEALMLLLVVMVSALAAVGVFNFTQVTPRNIKVYLAEHEIHVRL